MDGITKLNEKTILQKKFTRNVKGYDPLEVDMFLDEIRADYQNFDRYMISTNARIQELESRHKALADINRELHEKNEEISGEKRRLEIALASANNRLSGIKQSDHPTAENLQLINRIAELEKFLHDEGYNPDRLEHKR